MAPCRSLGAAEAGRDRLNERPMGPRPTASELSVSECACEELGACRTSPCQLSALARRGVRGPSTWIGSRRDEERDLALRGLRPLEIAG